MKEKGRSGPTPLGDRHDSLAAPPAAMPPERLSHQTVSPLPGGRLGDRHTPVPWPMTAVTARTGEPGPAVGGSIGNWLIRLFIH